MTDAYIYQAALLCSDCASITRQWIDVRGEGQPKVGFSQDDSDCYPNGPYGDGGGESDSPQHCDMCGTFLDNPLTPDGLEYVKEALQRGTGAPDVLATWRDAYHWLALDDSPAWQAGCDLESL
jgi:hypothetical protein